jgi:prepilin-type processing-associated H-X9-DG protein
VNNLKQIGLALQSYHDTYKCFPPAYVADADGKPMHSWRVLLLPFFEEAGLKRLYESYDFSEPWNGPHNSELSVEFPILFCPSEEGDFLNTSYVAVVGPETAWPDTAAMRIRGIRDGTSKTISVVEVANSGIHWMEPRDLTFEEALRGINVPGNKPGISSKHPGGANVLFCDGSVHFLSDKIPADTLRALLTANGSEDVKIPDD